MADTRPTAARLGLSFDPARLLADYETVRGRSWAPKGSYREPAGDPSGGWRCIPLRSQGGRAERTDPGGPGTEGFADTPLFAELPYLREVLASLPMPLRSARLLALVPGGVIDVHSDAPQGLDFGMVRLHIPIVTNPAASLTIGGESHNWDAGQLWYGDFGREHGGENRGDTARVHLVMDAEVTPALVDLFPADAVAALAPEGILFTRMPVGWDAAGFAPLRTSVPAAFFAWGSPLDERGTEPDQRASIHAVGDALRLTVDGGPTYGLVHVGDLEFRIEGWISERTLQLHPSAPHPHALFAAYRAASRSALRRRLLPA
jgi:hypothetical protein